MSLDSKFVKVQMVSLFGKKPILFLWIIASTLFSLFP